MTTMRHMCETIAKSKILGDKTPVEIFNNSSCGELFMVFYWYEVAKSHLNTIARLSNTVAAHHTDNPDIAHHGKVKY